MKTADDYEDEFGKETADTLGYNFYVEDCSKSSPTEESAIESVLKTKAMCGKGNFNLCKFISNRKTVTESVSKMGVNTAKVTRTAFEPLSVERVLGMKWDLDTDMFVFKVKIKDNPNTRRGCLSTLYSINDPLGIVAPFVLLGKPVLQEMAKRKVDWDEPIPEDLMPKWQRWKDEFQRLVNVKIPRCLKHEDFGDIQKIEVHHFSDASEAGYEIFPFCVWLI